jgi:trafficking protein particle complex subunit 3
LISTPLDSIFRPLIVDFLPQVGFKMFLGVTASVSKYDQKKQEFNLLIDDNPLTDFVELPEEYKDSLLYCNILCGVIRGALEAVRLIGFLCPPPPPFC